MSEYKEIVKNFVEELGYETYAHTSGFYLSFVLNSWSRSIKSNKIELGGISFHFGDPVEEWMIYMFHRDDVTTIDLREPSSLERIEETITESQRAIHENE